MVEVKPKTKRSPTPEEIQAAAEKHVSDLLRDLRVKFREQGFTLLQVEKKLGWKGGHLSALLGGKTALRADHLLAICEVIFVSPGELLDASMHLFSAADRALTTLLRTYAHPREALGTFEETELLAAAEERVAYAKGKRREYLQDVIRWCQASIKLDERTAKRRAGKERLSATRDPGIRFPDFAHYQPPRKRSRRQ